MIKNILLAILVLVFSITWGQDNQFWKSENLNVNIFRNGDSIPQAKTKEEWLKAEKEGNAIWCSLNFETTNITKPGKLYNLHAMSDPRQLAPKGWHIHSFAIQITPFINDYSLRGYSVRFVRDFDRRSLQIQDSVNRSETNTLNELIFFEDKPFTGWVISDYYTSRIYNEVQQISYDTKEDYYILNGDKKILVKCFKNGNKAFESMVENGQEIGHWVYYYENGMKLEEGNMISEYDYSDTINFPMGRLLHLHEDGLHTEWYENGQKKTEGNYVLGKENGIWKSWYETGEIKSEIQYDYKIPNYPSHMIYWYKDGQKGNEIFYTENGNVSNSKRWNEYGMEVPELGDSYSIQILWVIVLYIMLLSPFWILIHAVRIISGKQKWHYSHLVYYLLIISAFLYFKTFSLDAYGIEFNSRISQSIFSFIVAFIISDLLLVFGIRFLYNLKGKRLSVTTSVITFFAIIIAVIIGLLIWIIFQLTGWRPNA